MDETDIPAVAIHDLLPLASHGGCRPPLVLTGIFARFVRDVVAVVDENRDARERHEICERNAYAADRATDVALGIRNLAFGKVKGAARLKRNDGLDPAIVDRGAPSHPT